jgi:hypothetical protein
MTVKSTDRQFLRLDCVTAHGISWTDLTGTCARTNPRCRARGAFVDADSQTRKWALLPWVVGQNSGRVNCRVTQTRGPWGQNARWNRERTARGCKPKCVMRAGGWWDAGHLAGRKREGPGRYAGYGGDPGEYGDSSVSTWGQRARRWRGRRLMWRSRGPMRRVLVAPRVHARLETTICKHCVIFKLGSRGRTPGRVLPWQPTARRRSPPPQGRQSCSAHRIL